MCGSCPEGQGVDLTLRLCKDCGLEDSIGLAIICELLISPLTLQGGNLNLLSLSYIPLFSPFFLSSPLSSILCHLFHTPSHFSPFSTGVLVIVVSILVLIFNIGVPNDLKGFLFFAQVVGFVYQNEADEDIPWVMGMDGVEGEMEEWKEGRWKEKEGGGKGSRQEGITVLGLETRLTIYNSFLLFLYLQDFHMSRMLGFSVYLPICPFTTLPALWTAVFGLLPCVLAILTVIVYIIW